MVSKNADKSQQDRWGGFSLSWLQHCKLHSSSIFGHFLCGFPLDFVILTDYNVSSCIPVLYIHMATQTTLNTQLKK